MTPEISVVEKKEFIRWFLKRYQMKRRECVWILNYMLSHDDLLRNVHFVEEAHYTPRAMVMSVTESTGVPFRFYKGQLMTADAEKSFHDLRLNPDEDMYVQLNFPRIPVSLEYLTVLEEHKYMPNYIPLDDKDRLITEEVIAATQSNHSIEYLREKIDEALDAKTKRPFNKYVKELNILLAKQGEGEEIVVKVKKPKISEKILFPDENPKKTEKNHSSEAQQLIDKSLAMFEDQFLQFKINESLDNRDKEAFLKYSDLLKNGSKILVETM